MWQLSLERIMFVPTGQPAHKEIEADPGPEVRLRMVAAATATDSRFEVSEDELQRTGPSFMADTLRHLDENSGGRELHLLLGADAAVGLPGWSRPEEIVERSRLAIAMREGVERAELYDSLTPLCSSERITLVDLPMLAISSSMVRARVAAGRPIRYLVPTAVEAIVEEQRLYGSRQ